jgi:hypothetical protein
MRLTTSRVLKNPAYCGEWRKLDSTGGLVIALLDVAPGLRFRGSFLTCPFHVGLVRLAMAVH